MRPLTKNHELLCKNLFAYSYQEPELMVKMRNLIFGETDMTEVTQQQ